MSALPPTGDHAALLRAAQGDAALCTIVGIDGSFSRRVGTQLAVAPDGSRVGDMADKCLDDELANQALAAMAEGTPRMLRYGQGSPFVDFRLPCGSGLDIWIDPAPDRAELQHCVAELDARQEAVLRLHLSEDLAPYLLRERRYVPRLRIVLLGAGAESAALARLAAAQGVEVEWREAGSGLSLGRPPTDLTADAWTAVLLLFHDHEWEQALLDWALATPAFYIGAQGGAPAREERLERLRAAGHSDIELARIKSPVGLIPAARDPAVLALSVLADVVGAHEALHPARMSLAIAILAAGGAMRFGGGKLDAPLAGKPLGQWALDAALAVPHERMAIIVGSSAPRFAGDCEMLVNERAAEGLGTSAAVAARWAAGSDALLIVLADMPLVSTQTLNKLATSEGPAAVAYPGGRPGAPARFPAAMFPALAALTGDTRAAQVLRGLPNVTLIEAPGDELRDVDRPEDLADVAALLA